MTTDAGARTKARSLAVEWSTLGLIVACYAAFGLCLFGLASWAPLLSIPVMACIIAMHASLTHEALHGHPFRIKALNELMMLPALNLTVPYHRFRDLHLEHHRDANLTDPYDDPETNFLDPAVWSRMPQWKRKLFAANNTLLGRIALGPAIGTALFVQDELRAMRRGDRAVWGAWVVHVVCVAGILVLVVMSPMPIWAYLIAAYGGMSILKIRTFLEHRAHEKSRGRTVIIEDRGFLSFMFLNNNLHVVHHMHPQAAWYELPELYETSKSRYTEMNEGYVYRSYGEVFRQYFLQAKDSVPHPLWPQD